MESIIGKLILFCILVEISSLRLDSMENIIHKDARKFRRLFQTLWSYRPDGTDKIYGVDYCPFIRKCCTHDEQIRAVELLFDRSFYESQNATVFSDLKRACERFTANSEEECSLPYFSVDMNNYKEERQAMQEFYEIVTSFQDNDPFSRVYDNCELVEFSKLVCSIRDGLLDCISSKLVDIQQNNGPDGYQAFVKAAKKTGSKIIAKLSSRIQEN